MYPVTSAIRIEQDIKPQLGSLVAGSPQQLHRKISKNLEPVVQLVPLNLEFGTEEGSLESDADDNDDDNTNDEMPDITIKQEIDFDEPTTSTSETFDEEGETKRGRKRKSIDYYDDDYEEYTPVRKATARKKTTPRRVNATKIKKVSPIAKSPTKSPVKTTTTQDGDDVAGALEETQNNGDEWGDTGEDGVKTEAGPKQKKK